MNRYKLSDQGRIGTGVIIQDQPEIDEARMSVWIPFADGNNRDLCNAFPSLANNYVTYSDSADLRKTSTDLTYSDTIGVESTDSPNVVLSEFCHRTFSSAGIRYEVGSMFYHVSDICRPCIPSEVTKFVVSGISVRKVTAFLPDRTWTYEGEQNKATDFATFRSVEFLQVDVRSTYVPNEYLCHTSKYDTFSSVFVGNLTSQRFDSTPMGYTIKSLVFGDIPPVFYPTIRMDLRAFVQRFAVRIANSHNHLPSVVPYEVNRAGGREYRSSVRRPSLSQSYGFNSFRQGGA